MVDEVSMMNYEFLNMLDRFLHVLMENDQHMGGKLIILMNEFRQILPVIPGGSKADIVSCWKLPQWLHKVCPPPKVNPSTSWRSRQEADTEAIKTHPQVSSALSSGYAHDCAHDRHHLVRPCITQHGSGILAMLDR